MPAFSYTAALGWINADRNRGSPMACSHTSGCPLFPKLNASLRGWRDAYCDSDAGWKGCARYTLSLTGQSVPITLLPNGKYAQTVVRSGVDSAAARPRSRFESLPRVSAAAGSPFEEAPPAPAPVTAAAASSVWDTLPSAKEAAAKVTERSADSSAAAPTAGPTAGPTAASTAASVRVRPAPQAARPSPPPQAPGREGWWTRLVNWMRGPA